MRYIAVLFLLLLTASLPGQTYVYTWYPGINQRMILNNKYTDSLRIKIVKPMGMHKVRYDIDVYTVGKACMITHGKDSTGWVGSRNKGEVINGYVHFIDGKIQEQGQPCDSIPLGHLDQWYRWYQSFENCNDHLRYTINSYSSEQFTIHFNRHEYNVLYLYVHATPTTDRAEAVVPVIGTYNALGQSVIDGGFGAWFINGQKNVR